MRRLSSMPLVAKHVSSAGRVMEGKQMLARIVGMLTKLVQRYSDEQRLDEGEVDVPRT